MLAKVTWKEAVAVTGGGRGIEGKEEEKNEEKNEGKK